MGKDLLKAKIKTIWIKNIQLDYKFWWEVR